MAGKLLSPPTSGDALMPRVWRERCTFEQYRDLIDSGEVEGLRLQLIYGRVYEMSAMGPEHLVSQRLLGIKLPQVFDQTRYIIDINLPRSLEEQESEPEPDGIVYKGSDPRQLHFRADQVALIVEVSMTTLAFDQTVKQRLYAESGHQEYWIVNLNNRTVEVRRSPQHVDGEWQYAELTVFGEGDSVTTLEFPVVQIPVADLLP